MRALFVSLAVVSAAFVFGRDFNAKTDPTYYIDFLYDDNGMERHSSAKEEKNSDPCVLELESMGQTILVKLRGRTILLTDYLRFYPASSVTVTAPSGYVVSNFRLYTKDSAGADKFELQGGSGDYVTSDNVSIGYGASGGSMAGGEWSGLASEVTFSYLGIAYANLLGLYVTCTPDDSAIEVVEAGDDVDCGRWFDLQGREVAMPRRGVYVRVSASGSKVVVL